MQQCLDSGDSCPLGLIHFGLTSEYLLSDIPQNIASDAHETLLLLQSRAKYRSQILTYTS